eukprot:1160722-Pelagomonas_calceolata.AAC.9
MQGCEEGLPAYAVWQQVPCSSLMPATASCARLKYGLPWPGLLCKADAMACAPAHMGVRVGARLGAASTGLGGPRNFVGGWTCS